MNLYRKELEAERKRTRAIGKVSKARTEASLAWKMYLEGCFSWEEVVKARRKVKVARNHWLKTKENHEEVYRAKCTEERRMKGVLR